MPTKNRAKSPNTGKITCEAIPPETVHQVIQWLISGAPDIDVREAAASKFPEHKTPAVMEAAYNFCRQHAHPDPDTVRGWVFLAARDLYRRQIEVGDFASALRTLREIDHLAHA